MLFNVTTPAPKATRRTRRDMAMDMNPLFEGLTPGSAPAPKAPPVRPTTPAGPLFALMTAPPDALPGMAPFGSMTPSSTTTENPA